MILALAAYFLQHWQTLQIVLSLAVLALAPLVIFLLPESPRWLVANNQSEKALDVFRRGAKMNDKYFHSSGKIFNETADFKNDSSPSDQNEAKTLTFKSFFTEKVLLKNIVIISTNCLVATLCYYGISFNSVNIGTSDIYLSFALSAVFEIAGYVSIIFFLDHLGRRTLLIWGQLLTGVMCIVANFLQDKSETATLVCTLIGKLMSTLFKN